MAATRTLLLLFTSILLLFTVFWFSPFSNHYPSPRKSNGEVAEIAIAHDELPTLYDTFPAEVAVSVAVTESPAPVVDEKDVVVLSQKNFSRFIAENRYVMVNFYAPWCYWSKRLAPEYAAAATMIKGEAVLAKVDATVETRLTGKYGIDGYPTMYLFIGGAHTEDYRYYSKRTRDAMVNWVKQKKALTNHNIFTTFAAESVLSAESIKVVAFLDNLEGPDSEELTAASKLQVDVNFYQTNRSDIAEIFHIDPQIKPPALVMLNKDSETYSQFSGPFTRSAIADFVSMNKQPSVTTFTLENAPLIFENPAKQLWLFAPTNDSEKVISTFQLAEKAFNGKLIFIHVEIGYENVGRQLSYEFGVSGDAARVVAYSGCGDAKKHVLDGDLTLSNIKSFGEDFLEDKLVSVPIKSEFKERDKF